MGPIWGRQDPGGSHVGHMNFAILVSNNPTEIPGNLETSDINDTNSILYQFDSLVIILHIILYQMLLLFAS